MQARKRSRGGTRRSAGRRYADAIAATSVLLGAASLPLDKVALDTAGARERAARRGARASQRAPALTPPTRAAVMSTARTMRPRRLHCLAPRAWATRDIVTTMRKLDTFATKVVAALTAVKTATLRAEEKESEARNGKENRVSVRVEGSAHRDAAAACESAEWPSRPSCRAAASGAAALLRMAGAEAERTRRRVGTIGVGGASRRGALRESCPDRDAGTLPASGGGVDIG